MQHVIKHVIYHVRTVWTNLLIFHSKCYIQPKNKNTNNKITDRRMAAVIIYFLEFVGQMLCNMIKVCANAIKVYVSLKMLERPSDIFERIQKCYKTFKGFITCYNGLYGNDIRCGKRSNSLFLTCCRACCMACLNGLSRV